MNSIYRNFQKNSNNIFDNSIEISKTLTEILVMHHIIEHYINRSLQGRSENLVIKYIESIGSRPDLIKEANRLLSLSADIRPHDFRVNLWTGMIHQEDGNKEEALRYFQKAGSWFSGNTLAFYYSGQLFDEEGDNKSAERYYSAAIQGNHYFKPALVAVGLRRYRSNPRVAARLFAQAIEFNPHWLYGGTFAASVVEAKAKLQILEAQRATAAPGKDASLLEHFEAGNLEAALAVGDRLIATLDRSIGKQPFLLVENFSGYSIYRFRDCYYGIHGSTHRVGPTLFRAVRRGVVHPRNGRKAYWGPTYQSVETAIHRDLVLERSSTNTEGDMETLRC